MKRTGYELFKNFWWVLPLIKVAFCIVIKKGCGARTMCGWGSTEPDGSPESAGDILDKRYAHGEIDRKEYEKMKIPLKEL